MIPAADNLPQEAFSPFEWPEYLFPTTFRHFLKPIDVGTRPPGVYQGIWPLYIEEYRSDKEPALTNIITPRSALPRLMLWRPLTRTDIPAGWRHAPFAKKGPWIGFTMLTPAYFETWHKNAHYYRNRFIRREQEVRYTIIPISYEQFATAFAQSTVAKEIPTLELQKLKIRLEKFPDRVTVVGVQRIEDGKIVAGLSAFDSPANKATHYGCGFYLHEVRSDHLMVALMDKWFSISVAKGLRVLHLGVFSSPHSKGRAKSISEFKSQFVTHLHPFQPALVRLVRSKK